MKLLFVLESANMITNGTSATCLRFAEALRERGHEVRLLGCEFEDGNNPEGYYALPKFTFPIFEPLIRKEGFTFCHGDLRIIYEAVAWADEVHTFLPFKLSNKARLMAIILNKPVSTAFHLLPQNITSALHLGKIPLLDIPFYYGYKKYFYNYIKNIHCPSLMTKRQLEKRHYDKNELFVISNGVIPFFKPIEAKRPEEWGDRFVVVMSGRLASEKRQDLIIKAVAKSKYNEKIQVVLCGQGPNKKRYYRLAKKRGLANPLIIQFCNQEQLRDIFSTADLYVHASDFEIEGISAIEALACGIVPVISDSTLSATNTFSLDDHCLFRHGKSCSLRDQIEWFYEHPEERERLSKLYIEEGKKYALSNMVDAMEKMFIQTIEEHKAGLDLPSLKMRSKDKRKIRRIIKKLRKSGIEIAK